MPSIRVKFIGALKEAVGREYIEVEAEDWIEALKIAKSMHPRLSNVIGDSGEPKPGYMVFVDGVDYRIADRGFAREVIVLPIVHGGLFGG
jgi:molybdopterin converting factor small subunit